VAVRYGYQRYSTIHMVAVIIVIFVIVMVLQGLATLLAKRFAHKSRPDRVAPTAAALRASATTGAV
jgi:D-methionine transport system permease protein